MFALLLSVYNPQILLETFRTGLSWKGTLGLGQGPASLETHNVVNLPQTYTENRDQEKWIGTQKV